MGKIFIFTVLIGLMGYSHSQISIEQDVSQQRKIKTFKAVKSYSFESVVNLNPDDIAVGLNYSRAVSNDFGLSLIGFYHVRPYQKKIIVPVREHFSYQFKEFRNMIGVGLRKDLFLGGGKGLYVDLAGTCSFGFFSGAQTEPDRYIMPAGGLGWFAGLGRGVLLRLGYMYSPMYLDNPHRFSMGLDFNILRRI